MKRIRPISILALLGIITFAFSLHSCKNNKKKQDKVVNLAIDKKPEIKNKKSFHTSKHIGIGGTLSEQWKKSDSLYTHTSTKKLIELASDQDDVIESLIAFRALLMKNPHKAVNLAISEIDDTTNVSTLAGCCRENDCVSNVRISMIQYARKYYKVSMADSIRIDSALLFSNYPSKFYYIYHLYHKLPAKPEYEKRLLQLYKHDQYALIALARYHRVATKQEIIRLLSKISKNINIDNRDTINTVLDAVTTWPSESYKHQVIKVCQHVLNNPDTRGCYRNVFGALMAYNDKWSYNYIDKTLSKAIKEKQVSFDTYYSFLEAYEANPLPLFKPLVQKYKISLE